jgi:hypothetical protein
MLHKELSLALNAPIYVIDFCFPVGPGIKGINLAAIHHFVFDLVTMGQVGIRMVNVDKHESENLRQFLADQNKIPCEKFSVDIDKVPYLDFNTSMLLGTVKAGRNIFLKNNLDSLYVIRKKGVEIIDHSSGKTVNVYNNDWDTNILTGKHAKDVGDATCQALFRAIQDKNVVPTTIFEKENERLRIKDNVEEKKVDIGNALDQFRRKPLSNKRQKSSISLAELGIK